MKNKYCLIFFFIIVLMLGCTNKDDIIIRKTFTMGTMLEIQVAGVSKDGNEKKIRKLNEIL